MKKEKFMEMLAQAKKDEYGRLYVLGKYNNKIYFGPITTICEDIFKDDKHDENIEYKEPERIGEIKSNGNEFYSDYIEDNGEFCKDYCTWIDKVFSEKEQAEKYVKNSKENEQKSWRKLQHYREHDFWLEEYTVESEKI